MNTHHLITLLLKKPQPSFLFCDCAVACSTQSTLPHPIRPPPSPLVPPIPYSLFQLVYPLPTSVCLSACHPRVMPLSQPLGALLTPQHSVFAQSFGSRIQGWIVNYSRSACAPQPPALYALPRPAVDSSPWQWGRNLFSLMCPLPALPPSPFSSSSPPPSVQSKGSLRESHGQEVLRVHPTECRSAVTALLGKKALRENVCDLLGRKASTVTTTDSQPCGHKHCHMLSYTNTHVHTCIHKFWGGYVLCTWFDYIQRCVFFLLKNATCVSVWSEIYCFLDRSKSAPIFILIEFCAV